MSSVADRNVQFVLPLRCRAPDIGTPTELMANCGNLKRCGWLRSILDRVNHRGPWLEQNDYDQIGMMGPGQLNLGAAIYLGRLALIIRRASAELYNGIGQQGENDQKINPVIARTKCDR